MRTCEALARMDLRPGNRRIDTPTLIVAGRQDMSTPLAMSQAWLRRSRTPGWLKWKPAHQCCRDPRRARVLLDDWIRTLPA